jgi:hypothetical protein
MATDGRACFPILTQTLGEGMKVIRWFARATFFVWPLIMAATVSGEDVNSYASDTAHMLDTRTPIAERQRIFDRFEQRAQAGNVTDQYLVGSLYRVGHQLPGSPVASDNAKASLYLSNAAVHGNINAMAKMAELSLAARDYLQAMTWAQIYAHYSSPQFSPKLRPAPGYLAELLDRLSMNYKQAQDAEVLKNVNRFIAAYDADVQAGLHQSYAYASDRSMKLTSSSNVFYPVTSKLTATFDIPLTKAGIADYVIGFKSDGTVGNVWLLDMIPDVSLDKALNTGTHSITVTPAANTADATMRYAIHPIVFDDKRFRLLGKQ